MSCALCGDKAQYRDRHSEQLLCLKHARLEIVAAGDGPATLPLKIRAATPADRIQIEALALHFWDETEVECFDRAYDVLACPALLACDRKNVVGLLSYALETESNATILVMLNVLPSHQGHGAGYALLNTVRDLAAQQGLGRLIVATSNDDLPALALYQRYGFYITGIETGRIAQHHGSAVPGFSGIPIRDEIRLEYRLSA